MEGDRIETDKHSSAILMLPGRMIALGSSSSAVFHNGNLVANNFAANAKDKDNDDKDKDKDRKKKCISPKKPGKDKDCDDDGDDDHDQGHGNGNETAHH